MAVRTTTANVEGILVGHYDGSTDLTPFIGTASSIVDKVASNDSDSALNSTTLELIERWLAAHFYEHADQFFQSKNTGRASATFQGATAMHFQSTYYGQTAMSLDCTGYLAKLQQQAEKGKQTASATWMGTRYTNDTSQRSGDQTNNS